MEDNAESESPLKTDNTKPIVESTKTGENFKRFINGDGARQFLVLFYYSCLMHNACSALQCIFLQKKFPIHHMV